MKGWDHILFEQHQLIATSPLKPIACLDVFHKVDSHGMFGRKPVVARVGSMLSLAKDNVEGWPVLSEEIKDGLALLETTQGRDDISHNLFQTVVLPDTVEVNVTKSTSFHDLMFGAAGYEFIKADLNTSESLCCSARNVTKDSVKPDLLEDIVNDPPKWRPNTARKELEWPQSSGSKFLWVVTEVLYANKIVVGRTRSRGVGATLVTPDPLGAALGVRVSKSRDGSWVVSSAEEKRVPFAFRATRLEYTWNVRLITIKADSKQRVERRGDDPPKTKEQLVQESIVQMQDFFNLRPTDAGSEEEWKCLERVDVNMAELSGSTGSGSSKPVD